MAKKLTDDELNIDFNVSGMNEALIENLSYYTDALWIINLPKKLIKVVWDVDDADRCERVYTLKHITEGIKSYLTSDDALILKKLDIKYLRNLKESVTFNDISFIKFGKKMTMQWVLTPEFGEEGKTEKVFASCKNIQDIVDDSDKRARITAENNMLSKALADNSIYTFKLDVDDGHLYDDVVFSDGTPMFRMLGITFPVKFDDAFNDFFDKLSVQFRDGRERRAFTIEGLRKIFSEGKNYYSVDYYLPLKSMHITTMILLVKDPITGHLIMNAIAKDVTEKVRELYNTQISLKEALEEAEHANKAKTQFLNNMSHDIRTPMNAIIGMTRIAIENNSDREKVNDCLDKINRSSEHLLSLINDVLDMSKLESGNMVIPEEPIDIISIMKECLEMMEPIAKRMQVKVVVHEEQKPENRYVISSALHLRQIFINIASNGIKYNKNGGILDLGCYERPISDNEVEYKFVFKDTGIGMDEEFMLKIFEPFSQESNTSRTIYKGTGLGLSIVKSLVEQMGGEIEVTSKKDVGSTFTITIPFKIDVERSTKTVQDNHDEQYDLSGTKVLLVEDNELNVEIAVYALESAGMIVTTAENGKHAVEVISSNPPGTFDVVLMDIMMPVMDGYEATGIIRSLDNEELANIPIIAMTANAYAEDAKKSMEGGMNAHIAKPINIGQLMTTIQKVIK